MDQQTTKTQQARFASRCTLCGKAIHAGQMITWSREQGARCTTSRPDYTTSPEHPAIVATTTVATATVAPRTTWTQDEDRGFHEPTFRADTLD